jgi:diphthamide biosynthesis methyltransferase
MNFMNEYIQLILYLLLILNCLCFMPINQMQIVYGTLGQLLRVDFGGPLHCMAICGKMHELEEEVIVGT